MDMNSPLWLIRLVFLKYGAPSTVRSMTSPLFLIDPSSDESPLSSDELRDGWVITLPDAVARHALKSMRLQQGDELMLSDGQGLRVHAVVDDAQSHTVRITKVGRDPAVVTRIGLIQALAKQGRDEQAIESATEIGVDEVTPWQAHRSIVQWKGNKQDKGLDKWQQVLNRATEQSRRSWCPQLHRHITTQQLVQWCLRANVHGDLIVILHQDATDTWDSIESLVLDMAHRSCEDGKARTVHVVVGPEGGIADEEIEAFTNAGAHVVALGSHIMRASTAGPVAVALLSRVLGRYDG